VADFIGRNIELERLGRLLDKPSASLIVVKGRRRIGKSRLLQEFGKQITAHFFTGLPPTEQTTAETERREFAAQLERAFGLRGLAADDWGDLFWNLAQQTKKGRVLVVLDEITWMGASDPDFLGKLKTAWDLHFSKNPELILALCGSLSGWIEKNILSSTGFLGRESLTLTLRELPIETCKEFWYGRGAEVPPFEMLRMLAVTGGVPRYLEEINPNLSAEENIRQLCFEEGGILFGEFGKIFSDLFEKKNLLYERIVSFLVSGPKTQKDVAESLGHNTQVDASEYLETLVQSDFISRDYTWNIRSGKQSRLSVYRLSDNYSRFYLKYILPNKDSIIHGDFVKVSLSGLPAWSTIMGFQVENLVLSNRQKIKRLLRIPPEEVVADNPFMQRKTKRQLGCQIDYMVQTRFNTLYVCEVKFSRNVIGPKIIEEMQEKIDRIALPKNFFCRPVLIHVNGVSDEVLDSNYFSHIIDMAKLFE